MFSVYSWHLAWKVVPMTQFADLLHVGELLTNISRTRTPSSSSFFTTAMGHECQAEGGCAPVTVYSSLAVSLTRSACAIQDCLTRNNYNDAKCQDRVRALYACCDAMYKRGAAQGKSEAETKSDSCPLLSVVKRKMKQFEQ